jgi:hypothetical protein
LKVGLAMKNVEQAANFAGLLAWRDFRLGGLQAAEKEYERFPRSRPRNAVFFSRLLREPMRGLPATLPDFLV